MRAKDIGGAFSRRLSQRRIARSIAVAIALTLFQSISLPASYLSAASAAIVTSGTCSVDGTNMTTSNIIDNTSSDGTCTIRFTSGTSSFVAPTGINTIAALVVAGGGGGGFGGNGGGGGAGAVIVTDAGVAVTAGSTISGTVGGGGSSGYVSSTESTWTKGGKGVDSSISVGSNTFVASGGGGGSSYGTTADDGGSGGGKAINGSGPGAGYNYNYASWSEYVNSGSTHSGVGGGGGGGAGGSPATASSNGGVGLTIWGYSVGGGGSGWSGGSATVAAPFGGGAPRTGTAADGCNSCNGGTNTGGGGGGGGAGGSGVIVLKYVPSRGQGTIAQSNGFQLYRKTTFTFTRTGTAPTSATSTLQWQVRLSGSSTWSNVTTGTGGATSTYQTANLTRADSGNSYRIAVTDSLSAFGISTTTYTEVSAQTLFISPGGETDTALTTSGTKYATLSSSNPLIPGTVSTMTLQAWVKPTTTCDGAVACSIISVNNSYLVQVLNGKIRYYIGSGSAWCDGGASTTGKIPTDAFVPGDRWSHITFVRVNANVKIYINGQLRSNLDSSCSPSTQAANSNAFFIGVKAANTEAFSGSIDEVRIWSTDRSANAASDMHSNETSTSGLLNYWNFNEGTGTVAYNDVAGALSTTDLTITDATTWDANVVSDAVVGSVYTTRTFYRSYITEFGGWKVPSSVSMASTLVIAGGGGGGSRVGGGGGAGGFAYIPKVLLTPNSVELIQVGQGGFGAQRPLVDEWRGQNGQSSFFGTKVRTVGGGGGAGYDTAGNNSEHDGKPGGSGGGASSYTTSGGTGTPGSSTQVLTYGYGSGNSGGSGSGQGDYPAGGGGGAGGAGFSAVNNSTAAAGGAGIVDPIGGTTLCYAAGGGGGIGLGASGAAGTAGSCGAGTTTTASAGTKGRVIPADATPNSGSGGGGAGYQTGSTADVAGGNGGSGVIIIRWITALKPTYTKPVNAYLNVGMTETFTTNVAQDSATAILTRTFRWESTTGGSNGTFFLLKQGTGAANASFSWVPTDTSTSGSNYLYRLIVTDSDTAGLFITDSSTAFAVINRTLAMSGATRINKAINVSRSETFTITFGTPVYNATLSPVISGITLDTSTASSPVIRIAETATVGTYYETLTVTDSVSASVVIPLTINILPPPTLLNTGEIVSNDLVFHLETGNSASLIGESGTATTGITWRDISGSKLTAATGAGVNTGAGSNTTCTAPTYTSANGGSLNFTSGSDNCYYTSGYTGRNLMTGYTAEAWFKTSATLPDNTAIITQATPFSNVPTYIYIGNLTSNGLIVGFYDNWATAWRFANCAYTPVIGAWTHIAGTYDGTTLTTYINGNSLCSATASNTSNTVNIQGLLIGKGVIGATNTTFPGSIASVRIYKSALTAAQIQANFNATRFRFDSSNNTAITPTKKYGDSLLETFTATSGSDTRTITFSVGDRSGIDWDTTTVASQVRLTLQESLTVGSFIDTVTVTDALGQSTYLPFRMTTSKADSFTITMSAPTVITYNGSPITVYPRPTVTGLKWTDTATAISRFSSALYTESTAAPTNADTYTVRGNTPTFTLGSLDNYLGVIYETSTATINKANQRPLNVFMYGGTVGSSYLIWLQGGNGTGEVTETLTGTASISGCAINNHYLSATEQKQGFCEVRVVKAGDQNYFAETQTVQLYFMAYINNQPTSQVGSGSTIGLNGATSLETSTVQPPVITTLSTLTISLSGGGSLMITGTGFNGTVTVKFWRNKTIDKTSGNGTSISVSASELNSIGATTGRVSVITSAGQAVSADTLTITP